MKTAVFFYLFFTLAAVLRHAVSAENLTASGGRRAPDSDPLMGSVVKSDKWKMDRKNNLEFFDGAVSFKNPSYTMRSDHAIYNHSAKLWDIYGSAYILRTFPDLSKVEINCEKGKYFETGQTAFFERGRRQISMKYYFPASVADNAIGPRQASVTDSAIGPHPPKAGSAAPPPASGPAGGPASAADSSIGQRPPKADRVTGGKAAQAGGGAPKELHGLADKAKAENTLGLMSFEGDFSLTTENLRMLSQKGLYRDLDKSFLMYESTPLVVGTTEGYDFAINAEKMKFFRDSRDIKFYNNVFGWVKDLDAKKQH
ncbi:MAG: hypothetical protein A2X34_07145 [Elusimicrobia bacterium GWC2_51_8]|nr:MAG: hypothetical protein A2X33_05915 [Elusimicrobia bacterium GWA2_51_34]OGR62675.1 MAG: hypothetical protein A2X34_07145 [Elusimicrobia bacterium GWC2_51_8]OGR88181.1 MAG: hypothetical protein A2021_01055 [Elusimicrobia bacterium GWF2_52_66]HAF95385.1 hypothetical protein [Elusimicrobiota bacterium]HCE98750.1 hypothetical protein [Elusimicrobiota bacterium]